MNATNWSDYSMAKVTTATAHGFPLGTRLKIAGTSGAKHDGFTQVCAPPPFVAYLTADTEFAMFVPADLNDSSTGGTAQAVRGIENLLVEGNVFELALPTGADPVPIAVHVDKAGATFQPHEQVIVRNNRFRYFGGLMGAYEGLAVQVTGARNVLVRDNVIETMPSNDPCNHGKSQRGHVPQYRRRLFRQPDNRRIAFAAPRSNDGKTRGGIRRASGRHARGGLL